MTNNTRENEMKNELKNEAIRKLESYLRTGVVGFFEQATDRCREIGINCERVTRDEAGAKNLLSHLLMW